jgi:hypothetical protein
MQDWSVPLTLSTGAFLAWLMWSVRPAIGWRRRRRVSRSALKEAQARIESAPDNRSRALALCDAADLVAKSIAGATSATGLYLRAIRSDPQSVDVVRRAAEGLTSRPRTLESILWRHLAAGSWTGPSQAAVRTSIDLLRGLYEGPLRNSVRARALANARETLGVE